MRTLLTKRGAILGLTLALGFGIPTTEGRAQTVRPLSNPRPAPAMPAETAFVPRYWVPMPVRPTVYPPNWAPWERGPVARQWAPPAPQMPFTPAAPRNNGGIPRGQAGARNADLEREMLHSSIRAKMMQDLLRNQAGLPSNPPGFFPR